MHEVLLLNEMEWPVWCDQSPAASVQLSPATLSYIKQPPEARAADPSYPRLLDPIITLLSHSSLRPLRLGIIPVQWWILAIEPFQSRQMFRWKVLGGGGNKSEYSFINDNISKVFNLIQTPVSNESSFWYRFSILL